MTGIDLPPSRIELTPEQEASARNYVNFHRRADGLEPIPDDYAPELPPPSAYPDADAELDWSDLKVDRPQGSPDDPPTKAIRAAMLVGDDIQGIPPPEPLITGVLDLDTLAALYGPPGSGKSFVALAWALCTATGTWWLGRQVTPGPVLYVVAEGAAGVGQRVTAWKQHEQLYTIDRMHWLPLAVNLRAAHWVAALADVAAEIAPRLIIIDTLSRSMVGGDENSAKDMTEVIAAADTIRRATGACVLLVHHTGKSESAGLRGHSSLLGALDTAVEVRAADGVLTLDVAKQKNHASSSAIRLRLEPVADSCVVARYGGDDMPTDELPEKALSILRTLHEIDPGSGVSATTWRESVEGVADRSFWRWRKRLLEAGLCLSAASNGKGPYSLSDLGVSLVTATTATELPPTATPAVPTTAATATPLWGGSSGSDTRQEEHHDGPNA